MIDNLLASRGFKVLFILNILVCFLFFSNQFSTTTAGPFQPLLKLSSNSRHELSSNSHPYDDISVPIPYLGSTNITRHPPRRLFEVFLVQSLSDVVVARIRLAMERDAASVQGFIVAQLGRTARGLLLSPLAVDDLLNASSGAAYLHSCGVDNHVHGQSSICAHLVLPPQPHELQDANDVSRWHRSAILRIIGGWTGQRTENRSVSWWPLREEDLILYLEPSVLPHPEALKRLVSVIASNSISLPFSLPISVEYVYHLGWVSRGSAKKGGGGEVFLANQLSSFGSSLLTKTSIDLPGSAILSLFGGIDAVIQQRLSQPRNSPDWAINFGHDNTVDVISSSIDQGIDVRGGIKSTLVKNDYDSNSFSALILNSLRKSNESNEIDATSLSSLQLSSPRISRSRFLFSYVAGRLGNYFINLLNSLALASVSNRVAILRSPEQANVEIFSRFFQSPRIPWAPFVNNLPRSLPSSFTADNALCMNTNADGFPDACGKDKSLASWVSEVGGKCLSFLSAPPRSPHPYTSPMLQLMGIRESEVLNPDTHPMGTRGTNYYQEVLTGSTALLAQSFNYLDYDYIDKEEWLGVRCAVDFSDEVLTEAWAFVGPKGRLGGKPFFAVHVRLEDFSYSFPGEDTFPPLENFVDYAGLLAKRSGLSHVFVASNGTPKEKSTIFSILSQMGLQALTHPLSEDALMGKFIDAAVASHASAFLGNKISTYSHLIAGQMICAGVGQSKISFFRAKEYADEKRNASNLN
jgi:hypothetical protein